MTVAADTTRAKASEPRALHQHTSGQEAPLALRPLLPRVLPECVTIAACLVLIWAAVLFTLFQLKANVLHSAFEQTATLARAFAESSERISAELDHTLLAVRHGFAEQGDRFDLAAWVRSQLPPDRMTVQVAMAALDGTVTQSTLPMSDQRVSVADRDHFRIQLDPTQDALFISKPVRGRISGQWTVQYTRKLLTPDGKLAGVVEISIGCNDLSRFYETLDIGNGFVLLAGVDGSVRALGPARRDALGTDLSRDSGFAAALGAAGGSFSAVTPWDGVERIVSFRRLRNYPLVVMVGYDADRAYREYRSIRNRSDAIGAAASLIILSLGGVWIQQRLRSAASRRALLFTLGSMSQGIAMVDNAGRVPVVNRRFVELLDLPRSLLIPGRRPLKAESSLLARAGLAEPPPAPGETRQELRQDGRIIEATSQRLPNGGLIHTLTDATDRRLAEARIFHLAHHDSLTGLANRVLLNKRLVEMLSDPRIDRVALICLDLDNFKVPNETLGHDAGDRLLKTVTRLLLELAGPESFVARSGGDEFTILHVNETSDAMVPALVDAIAKRLDEPINIDGTQFRLSASVGIAAYPEDGQSAAELLQHADTALYQAKSQGRGSVVRFNPAMDAALQARGAMERDLRLALRDQQIQVWFQPRFEIDPLRVAGFEALARWKHPLRGFISPSQFIPVAEQSGLIAELGIQVLEQACAFVAELPDGRIAVNLSPVQFFSHNLPDVIAAIMRRHGVAADRLELEVTEGVLINDEKQALRTLHRLHDGGLHLALDDFGTGYASLSYLRQFPFDRIKLDQSFVQAQERDGTTRAIIETVLTMARRLSLAVTAEGVETERQLALLRSQNCPEVQGYLLGKPMPVDEARRFYHAHRHAPAVAESASQSSPIPAQ